MQVLKTIGNLFSITYPQVKLLHSIGKPKLEEMHIDLRTQLQVSSKCVENVILIMKGAWQPRPIPPCLKHHRLYLLTILDNPS